MDIAYHAVYNAIKQSIFNGEFPVGSLLPSEPELEQMYHVSRTTIRKATGLLTQDGFIKPFRGIGTMILDYHITQNLNKMSSITEGLKEKGYKVSLGLFKIQVKIANSDIAKILNLTDDRKIIKIDRVICANDVPIAYLQNYLPYRIVPGFENYKEDFISLYRYLQDHYLLHFDLCQDKITAVNADVSLAKKLNVPVGFALLSINRKCISNGQCICYDDNRIRSDLYGFSVTLNP